MRKHIQLALTLLAGASLISAGPTTAAVVTPQQVTGLAGSAAGGAVGGPVGGFLGGIAGRLIGGAFPKKKQLGVGEPAPPPNRITPLSGSERVIYTGADQRMVDATPIREIEVDRGQPDAFSQGRPAFADASAPPGTLDYQYQRIRAGLPVDDAE